MLLVMSLQLENEPATSEMVLDVEKPLRSSVSLPLESKIQRIGLSLTSKSKKVAAEPVMLLWKP